jgi:hypothetical protein
MLRRNIMKFKRIIILTLLVLTILSLFVSAVYADVWVNGYYRKNGTYVQGYWRSDPNGNPYDNWSFPGNVNPYTGKVATGNPETYLKNYYDSNVYNDFVVWVNGYYREDGTYVQGHYRSSPDGNPYNNWSFPGNINPYTGRIASGNPETYLKNYYNYKTGSNRKIGFSSIDNVSIAVTINNIGKVRNAPPITIGSSIEDVIKVMGLPDSVQISSKAYKYRNSTVYFDDDFKVQSWDNRYGNLKVSLENKNSTDVLDIDKYLIDDIFKITNNNLNKKSTILPTNKSVGETIKAFQEYLKNN